MKGLALIVLLCSSFLHAKCPELNPDQFKELLREKKECVELIFFASWCSSCKKHFVKKKGVKQIFVATFDSEEEADKVCSKFSLNCYLDKGLAETFQVSSLPHVVKIP